MSLSLRPTRADDLSDVLALEADPDVAPWITRWTRERHLRAISDADESHMSFADGGSFAGFLLLAGLCRPDRCVELRRIALRRRGEGRGKNALALALDRCFDEHAASRVWLDVVPRNLRAARLYELTGFLDGGLPPDGPPTPLRVMSIDGAAWAIARRSLDTS